MAVNLKKYAVVGFDSELSARNALRSALEQFRKGHTPAGDLSRCEGNIVYLHADNLQEKNLMENFLLNQHGAQPKGCRCKV